MYEDYYGLSENPFGLSPDPKYHFRTAADANAFELVQYANRRRECFVAITGESGVGKTTFCHSLLQNLDRTVCPALVRTPVLSEEELLRVLLQEFGIVPGQGRRASLDDVDRQALADTLIRFLRSLPAIGAQALLVVDDAHNVPAPVLEQIRSLSILEEHHQKLLQVVLVGNTLLREALLEPELRQLDRRISVKQDLRPLSREETAAYVAHRLAIAAGGEAVAFSPGAVARVHGCTGGVPRLVNVLCDRAMHAAYGDRATRVRSGHVDRAAEALDLERPGRLLLAWAR